MAFDSIRTIDRLNILLKRKISDFDKLDLCQLMRPYFFHLSKQNRPFQRIWFRCLVYFISIA